MIMALITVLRWFRCDIGSRNILLPAGLSLKAICQLGSQVAHKRKDTKTAPRAPAHEGTANSRFIRGRALQPSFEQAPSATFYGLGVLVSVEAAS
jgi:hypothetical protein